MYSNVFSNVVVIVAFELESSGSVDRDGVNKVHSFAVPMASNVSGSV